MTIRFNSCAVTVGVCLIAGLGCAQPHVPGRYHRTTYVTTPVVYTSQPNVTYRAPAYSYTSVQPQKYAPMYVQTYTPTYTTVSQPSWQSTARTATRSVPHNTFVVSRAGDVSTHADEITREVNRQVAELEARVKRQIEEAEASFRRQMAEMERQVARQEAEARRSLEQLRERPEPLTTAQTTYRIPARQTNSSTSENIVWEEEDEGGDGFDFAALIAKVREWGTVATDYLRAAPWWAWGLGVVFLFMVVFLVSSRDAPNRTTFRPRDDNPWVIDPAN